MLRKEQVEIKAKYCYAYKDLQKINQIVEVQVQALGGPKFLNSVANGSYERAKQYYYYQHPKNHDGQLELSLDLCQVIYFCNKDVMVDIVRHNARIRVLESDGKHNPVFEIKIVDHHFCSESLQLRREPIRVY